MKKWKVKRVYAKKYDALFCLVCVVCGYQNLEHDKAKLRKCFEDYKDELDA